MDKYNYQIVFAWDNNQRIIFAGVTDQDVRSLIERCEKELNVLPGMIIENVVYQPVKPLEDGSKN